MGHEPEGMQMDGTFQTKTPSVTNVIKVMANGKGQKYTF